MRNKSKAGLSENSDFNELLRIFNEEKVKYLIVGGYAVIAYTEPRYTKVLDIWVSPDSENALKAYRSLVRFGAPLTGITADDFATPGLVYQLGVAPARIDLIMDLKGLDFPLCWRSRKRVAYSEVKVYLISRDHLIKNKKAVGRPQDLIDVENLQLTSSGTSKKNFKMKRKGKDR